MWRRDKARYFLVRDRRRANSRNYAPTTWQSLRNPWCAVILMRHKLLDRDFKSETTRRVSPVDRVIDRGKSSDRGNVCSSSPPRHHLRPWIPLILFFFFSSVYKPRVTIQWVWRSGTIRSRVSHGSVSTRPAAIFIDIYRATTTTPSWRARVIWQLIGIIGPRRRKRQHVETWNSRGLSADIRSHDGDGFLSLFYGRK